MPNRKPCPDCGGPMSRQSPRCRKCWRVDPAWKAALSEKKKGRPSYVRTPEQRQLMSVRTTGRKKGYPTGGSLPGVAEKIRSSWTPERREAARVRGLQLAADPTWRLRCGRPGELSPTWEGGKSSTPYGPGWTRNWKQAAWRRAAGRCELCQSDKPRDTHHKDFGKTNHALDNLLVLCRLCHKGLHAEHLAELKTAAHQHPAL